MSYVATVVANNVLNRAFREGINVSPMKLQKILYFIASEYQKRTHKPLFNELFETWDYGPVLRSVYSEFRPYSRQSIRQFAKDSSGQSLMVNESSDEELKSVIDEIWLRTKDIGAVILSDITHEEDSAWDRAYQAEKSVLDFEDIAEDQTYRVRLGMD